MFCRQSMVPWCLKFIPISCMGTRHAQGHIFDFSTNLYAPEHVHVVQIWIMHINALKIQLMQKKCPNEPRKITKIHTTLLLFFVGTRIFSESNKRQWISFRPQRWDVPYRKPSCLLWEAPVCEKHIPKPAPKWDKICTTTCWCRSMIACQFWWISEEFWIY